MNIKMSDIILLIQAIILVGKLILSRKINQQTFARDKGFFIIEETNYITFPEYQERFRDKFVLTQDNGISFYVSCNSDIIVCSSELIIDGVIQKSIYAT